jgi:hypothetical protein
VCYPGPVTRVHRAPSQCSMLEDTAQTSSRATPETSLSDTGGAGTVVQLSPSKCSVNAFTVHASGH